MKLITKSATIFFLVASLNINIQASPMLDMKQSSNQTVKQRQLNTIQDYNDFVSDMKKAVSYGKYDLAIPLGVLFMKDMKLDDGVKKADIAMALSYLRIALKHKNYNAVFYITMLENKNDSILLIRNTLKQENVPLYTKELLAIRYAEIILGDKELSKNMRIIRFAIQDIEPISYSSDNPTLDFSLAHLYYINKELAKANKFINSACNNPKANTQLLNLCLNDPYINNNKKGVADNYVKAPTPCDAHK